MIEPPPVEHGDPLWFREPTRREHWIAAGLFIGFGAFFIMLFFILAGWWFRWIILGLGVFSIARGVRHAFEARQVRREGEAPAEPRASDGAARQEPRLPGDAVNHG